MDEQSSVTYVLRTILYGANSQNGFLWMESEVSIMLQTLQLWTFLCMSPRVRSPAQIIPPSGGRIIG